MKVSDLISIGRIWCAEIRYRKPDGARKAANELAERINLYLQGNAPFLSVRVSPFQFYELLVYHTEKAYKYTDFTSCFDADMSMSTTRWIYEFVLGSRDIDDFKGYILTDANKKRVQSFVAIVFIAEYGRGYTNSQDVLTQYLRDVLNGRDRWSNLKSRFAPALTYREDENTPYIDPSSLNNYNSSLKCK